MGLGSGIRDSGSGKNLFRIPDPGIKKAPDPGSATLLNYQNFALNRTCSIGMVIYVALYFSSDGTQKRAKAATVRGRGRGRGGRGRGSSTFQPVQVSTPGTYSLQVNVLLISMFSICWVVIALQYGLILC
jgi:hypothetical protein